MNSKDQNPISKKSLVPADLVLTEVRDADWFQKDPQLAHAVGMHFQGCLEDAVVTGRARAFTKDGNPSIAGNSLYKAGNEPMFYELGALTEAFSCAVERAGACKTMEERFVATAQAAVIRANQSIPA